MKRLLLSLFSFFHDVFCLVIDSGVLLFRDGLHIYFKNQVRDIPVRILANGPSLTAFEYNDRLDSKYCLVNNSVVSPNFQKIRPEYYVLADPAFFNENNEQWKVSQMLLDSVCWPLVLFVPIRYKDIAFKRFKSNPYIKVCPFHGGLAIPFKSMKLNLLFYASGRALPVVQNVVVGAIGCMINSGYKTIELYGVDHSWTTQMIVNDDNQVCLKDSHYYDTMEVQSKVWYKVTGKPYRMCEILRDLANMFEAYDHLRVYADFKGASIINKTRSSFIDAFERK